MTRQIKMTQEQLIALESYVYLLLNTEGVIGIHVSHVIPSQFDQFTDFIPTIPGLVYERHTGWFRLREY